MLIHNSKIVSKVGFFLALLYLPQVTAEEATAAVSQNGTLQSMILFSAIFVMFYFLMIRPQNRKQKEHKSLLERLAVGDEVLTTGGILGKISKVNEHYFIVAISEGVEVALQKNAIINALPKGTLKAI